MSLKLIGSILVSLVGIFSAFELTRYHKKRVSTLDGIISLIFYVKGQVECYSRPISAILSTLPPRIARECNCQGGIECLEDVADGSGIYLDEECARIFDAFAAEFAFAFDVQHAGFRTGGKDDGAAKIFFTFFAIINMMFITIMFFLKLL